MLTDNCIEKIKSPAFKASGLLSYSFVLDEAIKHPDLQSDKALIEKLELLKAEINEMRAFLAASDDPPQELGAIALSLRDLDDSRKILKESSDRIMRGVESIQENNNATELEHELSQIIQCCAFDDLVGQRLTRVGKNLQKFKPKFESFLSVLMGRDYTDKINRFAFEYNNENLLNGPQNLADQQSQQAVDEVFNSKQN